MKKIEENHKKIYIKWLDHASVEGWFTSDDPDIGVALVHSFGFLVSEDKDKIVISHSVCSESSFADPISILKKCILSRKMMR